jgi:Ser/Thr protein kinase RdoA (MazF antagonist)
VYQCWLITREVPGARTLASLSLESPETALEVLASLTPQVLLLADLGLVHVDLHPGNVLAGPDGLAVIVDFDKAHVTGRSRDRILALYRERWHRAVTHHRLPAFLTHGFLGGPERT